MDINVVKSTVLLNYLILPYTLKAMMKKILLAGMFVLVSHILTAQYKPVLFGLRTGASIDWMKPDADQYNNEGIKAGFSWGFIADFFWMENYSIQTGFNVQYLYGKLSYPHMRDSVTGTLTRNYKLQYIQIPVVLKMQTDVSEKVKLFGKIGIGTGIRLRAKADDIFSSTEGQTKDTKVDIADEIALFRESFIIGGGVSFALNGSSAVIVDLTFDNGFIDILKGYNNVNTDTKQRGKLSLVELGVGIVF